MLIILLIVLVIDLFCFIKTPEKYRFDDIKYVNIIPLSGVFLYIRWKLKNYFNNRI